MPDIFAAGISIFESCLQIYLINRLTNGQKRLHTAWIILILSAVQFFMPLFVGTQIIRFFCSISADTLLIAFLWREKIAKVFVHTSFFHAFMFLCDGAAFIMVSRNEQKILSGTETFEEIFLYIIVSKAILPFLCYFYLKFWPKCRKHEHTLFLYPLPICVIIVLYCFFPVGSHKLHINNSEMLFIPLCFFIAASLGSFITAEHFKHKHILAAERAKSLETHNRLQVGYIREIQENTRYMAEKIHDIRHHLNLIEAYLGQQQEKRAVGYIEKIRAMFGGFFISYTGNADIDTILFSKETVCKSKGICLEITGHLPPKIDWLDTADLCVILANALSNAIEASGKIPGEKTVFLQFVYSDWLIIAVENPIAEKPKKDRLGRYISQKGKGHGYGMTSMETTAKKYAGRIHTQAANGKFVLEILLQNTKGDAKNEKTTQV
ncbi:MAG: GHKL domain-containing protein [Oscillospiraceae bacterium]|nr:GHKL domain-containing protein [Oscillospiraceae bacterium]